MGGLIGGDVEIGMYPGSTGEVTVDGLSSTLSCVQLQVAKRELACFR